jgi:hypothetical protein
LVPILRAGLLPLPRITDVEAEDGSKRDNRKRALGDRRQLAPCAGGLSDVSFSIGYVAIPAGLTTRYAAGWSSWGRASIEWRSRTTRLSEIGKTTQGLINGLTEFRRGLNLS